jgi:hypothetical protein
MQSSVTMMVQWVTMKQQWMLIPKKLCNVKGGCLASLQFDLTLGSRHNCINRLVVMVPHHSCMEMHGCLAS